MSIKDDFIYLNTTKKLLRNEINRVNNVLDDNSTFRSYPQELFNGYLDILNNGTDTLWSNLEKVSQIGTEAVLENVETAPMKIALSGNTSQDTTSGKNIFNIIDYSNIVIGGSGSASNINKTSNIISFASSSESASSGVYISNSRLSSYIDDYNSETIYHVSADITTDVACNFKIGTNNSSYVSIPVGTTRLSNSIQASSLVFYVNAVVANIKISNIMISTNQDTSYEPYTGGVASPNPDYPQDIQVVKGNNVVSVSGKNLFDKENTAWYRNNDSRFVWENNVNTTRIRTNSFKIEGGKTYVVSGLPSGISFIGVRTYEDDTPTGVSTGDATRNWTEFTLGQNVKYIHLLFSGENFTDDTNVMMKNANIQLEEGSTATPYVPYSKTDYPITLSAENHFKGEFRRGGAVSTTITTRLFSDDNYSMEAGKQYVFETNLDMTQFNFAINISTRKFPTTAMFDTGWLSSNKYVFTCAMNGHLGVPIRKKDDSIITLEDIDGVWFKLYEPIVETEETLELCKIKTYKDYFYKDSGKWYVHKEIEKITFNGSESWTLHSINSYGLANFYAQVPNYIGTTDNLGLTNYFAPQISSIVQEQNQGFRLNTEKRLYIRFDSNVASTVEDFKTWLSNNNVTLYYVLATPVEEEITNATLIEQLETISKAKSVKEKTYVTQTNDELPFILDIQAIKEYNVE